jgi:broad specificity phosphatase PhoE
VPARTAGTLAAIVSEPQRIHLVRHGEVDNPHHVVYATLDGYELSRLGRSQALETARHLGGMPIARVACSPLQRAMETAAPIATAAGTDRVADGRLVEWRMAEAWAGIVWETLPRDRPGELEAYLASPERLPFSVEQLWQLAVRVSAAVMDLVPGSGDLVVVSHQDPVEAARRTLTGRHFDDFHAGKPRHASVVTIGVQGSLPWPEVSYWEPDQGNPFPPPP